MTLFFFSTVTGSPTSLPWDPNLFELEDSRENHRDYSSFHPRHHTQVLPVKSTQYCQGPHPGLFSLMTLSKWFRIIWCRTTRHHNSFPQTIWLLNSHSPSANPDTNTLKVDLCNTSLWYTWTLSRLNNTINAAYIVQYVNIYTHFMCTALFRCKYSFLFTLI